MYNLQMWPRVGTPDLKRSGYHTYCRLYHEKTQHFYNTFLFTCFVCLLHLTALIYPYHSHQLVFLIELTLYMKRIQCRVLQLRCQYYSTRAQNSSSSKQYYNQTDKREKPRNLQIKQCSFELSGSFVYFGCQTVNGAALPNDVPSKLVSR